MSLFKHAPREFESPSHEEAALADVAAEQPILWLGMSGFSPQQRVVLEASMARAPGLPQWRLSAFGDADAWWINGAKVSPLPDGSLKVAAGLPTEHALHLNLNGINRPVAFGTPLAHPDFEPHCTFSVDSAASIQAVLLQFDNWLRMVRSQFVLGARIIQHGAQLRHGIFHVNRAGALLGVLDFKAGSASLSPQVHPVDLWEARWDRRPIGASDMPPGFLQFTPAQFAWAYVRRTDRDLLPPRYASELIYFRHVPKVPLRWLSDSQLTLVRELSAEPATLNGLRQRTGFAMNRMRYDLTCLYYAGSITTTRAKAAAPTARRDNESHSTSAPELESLLSKESSQRYVGDLTAPAMLEHRRPPGDDPARRA